MPVLSIVVPVFNEAQSIGVFLERVSPVIANLKLACEVIFVDDGSTDGTSDVIANASCTSMSIRLVRLSRNFGKEAALTAGLEASSGDAVIPMDVDLQDPPELIAEFVRLWQSGYEVVYGQRICRNSDSAAKRSSAGLFYWLFNRVSSLSIEPNVGDFRLMSRAATDATLQLRERNRFMKGIFAWVGFPAVGVPYVRPSRSIGNTKFNYWKLWNFALDGLTSFSTAPLRIWTYVGGAVTCGALLYVAFIILQTLIFGREVPGYASLMVVVLLLGAVQLVSLGIIGEYLGRLYMEAKQRPIYLVRDRIGFESEVSMAAEEAAVAPGVAS
ncbi:glycosyltransferase family 2 protein [Cereibacter sphaeroides]|uniref:glycosyltransferase family 2 protein n=1 Tax=Cereibacter sphaeroides TaxID=1063 RepID=UPI001F3927D4|nr:glycosyltransferase family 2 protein [Cereibacter sphaeroides]MCE6949509.1 glycosyltransferase family 2 protein [Cereibacter sphaeroides]MCE6957685.1 glycosyltransferase family 2 protein [Cereibacter sphaeroides]MCE6967068.1 glycosyltransferase family 2 protein [Cereibacter sphaeroides]MCE6971450.1 glycosyltransferase family 2 protein [Cereibacter sphaeroides]